ncbi:MAG: VTT domain-containing protein [Rhizobiales bacterium]|nr:VTT domain-containing protein [Hyphomicrobiales bacterium]NRB14618.1 VTT domain-containing protein [Hyphomicrobiales bacterium]
MKSLIKVFLSIVAGFIAIFIVVKFFGWLSMAQIEGWFDVAKAASPLYVLLIVVGLLYADLIISVPTLTITLLAGHLLGPIYGAAAGLLGVTLAGVTGYALSRYFNGSVLKFLVKDAAERQQVTELFLKHGFVTIMLSRALPMLPETCACLAGLTRMPFMRFLLAWWVASVPYMLIVAYAGSISSLDNPTPAIIVWLGVTLFLWLGWGVFHRKTRAKAKAEG